MVDLTGGVAVTDRRARSAEALWSPGEGWLRPRTVAIISAAITVALAIAFWLYEGYVLNVVFTFAVTLCLGALLTLATRRLLVSSVAIAAFVCLINFVSSAKRETLGMVLHAYDIVFYLGSWSTIVYLWGGARSYVLIFVTGLALTALACWLCWRLDGARVARPASLTVAVVCAAAAAWVGIAKPERRHTQFYWEGLYLSSFYSSWAETLETLWRGQIVEAAPTPGGPAFAAGQSCSPAERRPHIVLIHQESLVQPGLFPKLAYDHRLDPFFRSHDGKTHKMRVETYGGASWLTEFSILTGMSTHAFGGMRPFVQSLLAGKVRQTLPEVLAGCGYRNVLFYPMLRNFVSNARFYDAVGLKEIFDAKAQQAPTSHERDRFYFRNALDEMERHVKSSSQPLFTYIQTMSAHWPYDFKFEPGEDVPGGGPGTHAEVSEYLRRVWLAKRDYDELKSELRRRFPNEPILLVQYGDHQPQATRTLLGMNEETQVEDAEMGPESIGFTTYYAVEALNIETPPLPDYGTVDVPYLGTIILQQAGLPLPPAYRERVKLMQSCGGRYHTCPRRGDILSFHRRLIDSDLVESN